MRILSDHTVTTVTRTIDIADGPRLHAGPEWTDGIYFTVDKIVITNKGDSIVSGYRFRDGHTNKSYLHSLRFRDYPEWVRSILTDAYLANI